MIKTNKNVLAFTNKTRKMAILTIESSLLVSLSYEDIIKSFANQKAKCQLLKLK